MLQDKLDEAARNSETVEIFPYVCRATLDSMLSVLCPTKAACWTQKSMYILIILNMYAGAHLCFGSVRTFKNKKPVP